MSIRDVEVLHYGRLQDERKQWYLQWITAQVCACLKFKIALFFFIVGKNEQ